MNNNANAALVAQLTARDALCLADYLEAVTMTLRAYARSAEAEQAGAQSRRLTILAARSAVTELVKADDPPAIAWPPLPPGSNCRTRS